MNVGAASGDVPTRGGGGGVRAAAVPLGQHEESELTMNREQMVAAALEIFYFRHRQISPPGGECICGYTMPDTQLGQFFSRHVFADILNTILPEVSTEEELDAVPTGAILVDEHGDPISKIDDGRFFREHSLAPRSWDTDELAHDLISPLTVVWRP